MTATDNDTISVGCRVIVNEHSQRFDKVAGREGLVVTYNHNHWGIVFDSLDTGHDLDATLPPGSRNGYYVKEDDLRVVKGVEVVGSDKKMKPRVVVPVQSFKSQEEERMKIQVEPVRPNIRIRRGRSLVVTSPRIFDHLYH